MMSDKGKHAVLQEEPNQELNFHNGAELLSRAIVSLLQVEMHNK